MATKSITKSIVIRDSRRCRSLVRALERSEATDRRKIVSKAVSYEPTLQELQALFKGQLTAK